MPNLSADIWSDDNKLQAAFSWLTRIGVAPKFGTLPIAYYQKAQCDCIKEIESACSAHGLGATRIRLHGPHIQAFQPQVESFRAQWRNVAMITCGRITPLSPTGKYAAWLTSIERK